MSIKNIILDSSQCYLELAQLQTQMKEDKEAGRVDCNFYLTKINQSLDKKCELQQLSEQKDLPTTDKQFVIRTLNNVHTLASSLREKTGKYAHKMLTADKRSVQETIKPTQAAHNTSQATIGSTAPRILDWTQRPPEMRQIITKAFENISGHSSSNWGAFNGSEIYGICSINEHRSIMHIIQKASSSQKNFYVLDIGSGNFQWGEHLAKYINQQKIDPSITVHVINVRGECFKGQAIENLGRCTIYRLGAFKIEELSNEFKKHNLALENKVDLCISRWCFRHLADPVGTFAQAYNLLRPETGMLLIDGFFFFDEGVKDLKEITGSDLNKMEKDSPQIFNKNLYNLFLNTKAPLLMQYYTSNRSLNHFALKRPDEQPCALPMSYTGVVKYEEELGQKGSAHISKFQKEYQEQNILSNRNHSKIQGDRSLYQLMKRNGLFDEGTVEPFSWMPAEESYDYAALFPLHHAVKSGNKQRVEELLTQEAMSEKDPFGYTPLCRAIRENQMDIFELFLKEKADVDCPTDRISDLYASSQVTPLRVAIMVAETNLRYAECLLEKGARVNSRPFLLSHAIKQENVALVKLLVSHGATITSWEREQALNLKNQEIIKLVELPAQNL